MSGGASRFSIVCLSPQRWDAPLPTNRQQIMLRAAARGHEVLFVETSDFLGRQVLHLAARRNGGPPVPPALSARNVAAGITAVRATNVAPWGHRHAAACRLNNMLTARRIRRLVDALPRPVVSWLYDPCAAGVAERLGLALTAYDCVDDYAEQAGGDLRRRSLVAAADRRAATLSRVVFATTRPQARRLAAVNPNTHLVPNVGDFAHFAPAADPAFAAPELSGLRHPVIGFAGNMLPGKVDFDLLVRLAQARPEWTFLCVGPLPDRAAAQPLSRLPNVRLLGGRPYADLPRYVAGFAVGLIPYLSNEYTRSCFPLKLYEYLAAGKPVVATGLPELAGMEPDVILARSLDEVLHAVDAGLRAQGPADVARRQGVASGNTWESRASTLLELVEAELRG